MFPNQFGFPGGVPPQPPQMHPWMMAQQHLQQQQQQNWFNMQQQQQQQQQQMHALQALAGQPPQPPPPPPPAANFFPRFHDPQQGLMPTPPLPLSTGAPLIARAPAPPPPPPPPQQPQLPEPVKTASPAPPPPPPSPPPPPPREPAAEPPRENPPGRNETHRGRGGGFSGRSRASRFGPPVQQDNSNSNKSKSTPEGFGHLFQAARGRGGNQGETRGGRGGGMGRGGGRGGFDNQGWREEEDRPMAREERDFGQKGGTPSLMGSFGREANEDFGHSSNRGRGGGGRLDFGRGEPQAARGGGMMGGRPSGDFSADEDFDRRFGDPRERSGFPPASSSGGRGELVNPMFERERGAGGFGSRAEEGPSNSASVPTNPMFDSQQGPSRFSDWQSEYAESARRNADPPDHRSLGLGDPYPPPRPQPPKPQSAAAKRSQPEEPPLPPGHDAKTEKDYAKLIQQEKQFDTMFERWERNFEQWKSDNENNPDLEYVDNHLLEMNRLREKMLKRRQELKDKRQKLLNPDEPPQQSKFPANTSQKPDQHKPQLQQQQQQQQLQPQKQQQQQQQQQQQSQGFRMNDNERQQASQEPKQTPSLFQRRIPDPPSDQQRQSQYQRPNQPPQQSSTKPEQPLFFTRSSAGASSSSASQSTAIPGLGDGEDSQNQQEKQKEESVFQRKSEAEKNEEEQELSLEDRERISRAVRGLSKGHTPVREQQQQRKQQQQQQQQQQRRRAPWEPDPNTANSSQDSGNNAGQEDSWLFERGARTEDGRLQHGGSNQWEERRQESFGSGDGGLFTAKSQMHPGGGSDDLFARKDDGGRGGAAFGMWNEEAPSSTSSSRFEDEVPRKRMMRDQEDFRDPQRSAAAAEESSLFQRVMPSQEQDRFFQRQSENEGREVFDDRPPPAPRIDWGHNREGGGGGGWLGEREGGQGGGFPWGEERRFQDEIDNRGQNMFGERRPLFDDRRQMDSDRGRNFGGNFNRFGGEREERPRDLFESRGRFEEEDRHNRLAARSRSPPRERGRPFGSNPFRNNSPPRSQREERPFESEWLPEKERQFLEEQRQLRERSQKLEEDERRLNENRQMFDEFRRTYGVDEEERRRPVQDDNDCRRNEREGRDDGRFFEDRQRGDERRRREQDERQPQRRDYNRRDGDRRDERHRDDRRRDDRGRGFEDNESFRRRDDNRRVDEAKPAPKPQQQQPPAPTGKIVQISDLLDPPGRYMRPPRLVMIFRGLPGSGKSHVIKLLKSKEVEMGTDPPRILSLDDYFMCDGDYEYEAEMEESYRQNLIKSFKKQIDDDLFSFIIVDCVNEKTKHYGEMWSYAKQKGFEVYIAEMDCDPGLAADRNVHNRSEADIKALFSNWEETPGHYNRLDFRGFLQDQEIEEVTMEEAEEPPKEAQKDDNEEEEDSNEEGTEGHFKLSKWELMDNELKMAQLDGVSERRKQHCGSAAHESIEDWLEMDSNQGATDRHGKKRVRWADIEERRAQMKMREVGFVVGQTNWNRMMDPSQGESALTRTKVIPNRFQSGS